MLRTILNYNKMMNFLLINLSKSFVNVIKIVITVSIRFSFLITFYSIKIYTIKNNSKMIMY